MLETPTTAFDGIAFLASGPLQEVAAAVKSTIERGPSGPVVVYDDATGRIIDVDIRGTVAEMVGRLEQARMADATPVEFTEGARLGAIARGVTLLPRHWDWLASQPGGASVALRKLVEAARRASGGKDRRRASQEAAYRFLSSIAQSLPGYEEALRALFAYDRRGFAAQMAAWPAAIRDYAVKLAFADLS